MHQHLVFAEELSASLLVLLVLLAHPVAEKGRTTNLAKRIKTVARLEIIKEHESRKSLEEVLVLRSKLLGQLQSLSPPLLLISGCKSAGRKQCA